MLKTKSQPGLARQGSWRRIALMKQHERQIERKAQQLTTEDRQKAMQILKELFED